MVKSSTLRLMIETVESQVQLQLTEAEFAPRLDLTGMEYKLTVVDED